MSDTSDSPPPLEEGQTLYFAYGSNLSFDQMAKRCPGSRFISRARLHKHRFQINERGYANVVEALDDEPPVFVEGLCYRLTGDDEKRLDRDEGVPFAYRKKQLAVELFPGSRDLSGRGVVEIVGSRAPAGVAPGLFVAVPDAAALQTAELAGAERVQGAPPPPEVEPRSTSETRAEAAVAMVYLSTTHVKDGRPWAEYIERMKLGLQEALQLGISSDYVRNDVCPSLGFSMGVTTLQEEPPSSTYGGRRAEKRL